MTSRGQRVRVLKGEGLGVEGWAMRSEGVGLEGEG